MKTVGIGMIGCGGRNNGVVAQTLKSGGKRLKVVAAYDPNPKQMEHTRGMFNPDLTAYESYQALLKDPAVDWVTIGSWNCFHKQQVIDSFKAGKHVFCEKPLATTIEDCDAMMKAWKKSDRMFSIGFTLRYSPHYRKIRELIEQKTVGDIISLEFNETLAFNHGGYIHGDWRRKTEYAGTHLLEKCCHDLDLVNWMVQSNARRVASFGGTDFFLPRNRKHVKRLGVCKKGYSKGASAYESWQFHKKDCYGYSDPFGTDKDIIDNQVAIIEFANNVRATFHTNCNSAIPERRMYINGTEGAIRADVIAGRIEVCRIGWEEKVKEVKAGVSGGHGGGDEILGKSIADSMLKGKAPFTSLEDGLKSAVTAFGIDKAMETGKVVDMAPLWKKVGIKL